MKISMGVIKEIEKDVGRVLAKHQEEMHVAFIKGGDAGVGIDVKISVKAEKGKLRTITGINFVKDRCRDALTNFIDEEQLNIFENAFEKGEDDEV